VQDLRLVVRQAGGVRRLRRRHDDRVGDGKAAPGGQAQGQPVVLDEDALVAAAARRKRVAADQHVARREPDPAQQPRERIGEQEWRGRGDAGPARRRTVPIGAAGADCDLGAAALADLDQMTRRIGSEQVVAVEQFDERHRGFRKAAIGGDRGAAMRLEDQAKSRKIRSHGREDLL
jgi:hypothetical protein